MLPVADLPADVGIAVSAHTLDRSRAPTLRDSTITGHTSSWYTTVPRKHDQTLKRGTNQSTVTGAFR